MPCVAHLNDACLKNSVYAPVYCFMPDHVHILLKGVGFEADLYEAMFSFKSRAGSWLRTNHPKTVFQKGFYDHIIRDGEDWRRQATYIALNPVRAGLVDNLFDYPFTGSLGTELSAVVLRDI